MAGSLANSQNRVAWQVAYGEAPQKGSRAMLQLLDFTVVASVIVNLTFEQDSERLEFVQSIYFDNSSNPNTLIGVVSNTGQILKIPGGWQGYVPILSPVDNCVITFTTTGTPVIPIELLSFPVPAELWPAGIGSTGQDFSANKPVALGNLVATVPVNGGRSSIEVQNQAAGTIQVWLDDGAGANISIILLAPGTGANTQGADWQSTTFKGRVRVFASNSTDQVFVHQD